MLHLLPSPSFIFSVCYREKINLELLWKLLRAHSNVRSSSLLSIEELQTAESKRSDCWTLPEMRLLLAEARKKHLFFLMTCLLQSTSVISIKLWWNVNITKGGKDREKRKLQTPPKILYKLLQEPTNEKISYWGSFTPSTKLHISFYQLTQINQFMLLYVMFYTQKRKAEHIRTFQTQLLQFNNA